jgi:hypothetical protein
VKVVPKSFPCKLILATHVEYGNGNNVSRANAHLGLGAASSKLRELELDVSSPSLVEVQFSPSFALHTRSLPHGEVHKDSKQESKAFT